VAGPRTDQPRSRGFGRKRGSDGEYIRRVRSWCRVALLKGDSVKTQISDRRAQLFRGRDCYVSALLRGRGQSVLLGSSEGSRSTQKGLGPCCWTQGTARRRPQAFELGGTAYVGSLFWVNSRNPRPTELSGEPEAGAKWKWKQRWLASQARTLFWCPRVPYLSAIG
jgi:hypothetical protein